MEKHVVYKFVRIRFNGGLVHNPIEIKLGGLFMNIPTVCKRGLVNNVDTSDVRHVTAIYSFLHLGQKEAGVLEEL